MRALRPFLLATDLGFVAYWAVTSIHLIPAPFLFKDYSNPLLMAWNWSLLPLDLCISATGLASVGLYRTGSPAWSALALVSLTLTSCSGLQALAFWAIRADLDLAWWAPNLFLLIYPLVFIPRLLAGDTGRIGRSQADGAT